MRPTRAGISALLLAGLTAFAATSTGNNLLYLLLAATMAALALNDIVGRANLLRVRVRLRAPDQAFRGAPVFAPLELENAGRFASFLLRVRGPDGAFELAELEAGATARGELRLVLPHRGVNRLEGLWLESPFPFGLGTARRRVPATELLALPQASPFAVQAEPQADPRAAGAPGGGAARARRDGEFWGPRPYAPEDDARLIHWKLTAKSGRPVVAEHAAAPEGKVVVRLEGTDDAAVERAAAACRWHLDAGAETGLVGPGVEVAPARGLEQLGKLLKALAVVGDGARARPAPPAPKPVDPGPRDSRALRRLLLFGAALVYAAMFLIDEAPVRLLLMVGPLVPLGIWLHERGGPFPPERAWSAASLAFLVFLVAVDWKRSGVAMANAHLLAYLLVNRLLNPWKTAELRQVFLIIYLAFVLVSGLTINPWYLPLFAAWVVFAGAWLMMSAGADAAASKRWAPSLSFFLVSGSIFGAFVFAFAPRMEGLRRYNPFVASGIDRLTTRRDAVMGFTDAVTLGQYGFIRRSSARVLRLKPAAAPPAGVTPPPVLVRGSALDRFDGRGWSRAPLDFSYRWGRRVLRTDKGRAWTRASGRVQTFPLVPPPGEGADWDFHLYPMHMPVVFTVGGAWFLDGLDLPSYFDHAGAVRLSEPSMAGLTYRQRGLPSGRLPSDAATDLFPRAREAALQTPPDPQGRVAALAARWTRGAEGPEAKARAIHAGLSRGYFYTTYSDGRRTALEDFLFDTRRGNCEYFATAAAILLRHAGVPARLVTGFSADKWNEYGGFYDIRQSDAHAWVEYEVPGRGWLTLDATPADTGFAARAGALMDRLSAIGEALESAWYRRVVGYDQYSQRDAILKLGFGKGFAGFKAGAARLARGAAVLGVLLWLAWVLARLRADLKRRDAYEKAERALARAGLPRQPWQTPREFADAVSARRPDLAPVRELAERHERRRWGRVPGSPAEEAALLAELKSKL